MSPAFEIFYADGFVVMGYSRQDYLNAPDDGIQFVVARHEDGSIERMKAQSQYVYQGTSKPGSWTTNENYQRLKDKFPQCSKLM